LPAYVHKVTCFEKCFRYDTSLGEHKLGAQLFYHININIRMIQEQNPHTEALEMWYHLFTQLQDELHVS
jgi:hypothetical protein